MDVIFVVRVDGKILGWIYGEGGGGEWVLVG